MGWAKFDDRRHQSAKLAAAGLEANGLDANGITWCAAHETDGFIADAGLVFIAPGISPRRARTLAARLVEVGRWERDDDRGGWWVHDFLDYHPCHADMEKRRAEDRERKAAERTRATRGANGRYAPSKAESERTNVGLREGSEVESAVSRPVPSRPVPNPLSVTSHSSSSTVLRGEPDDDDDPVINLIVGWKRQASDVRNYTGWYPVVLRETSMRYGAALAGLRHEHPDWPDDELAASLASELEPQAHRIGRIGRRQAS